MRHLSSSPLRPQPLLPLLLLTLLTGCANLRDKGQVTPPVTPDKPAAVQAVYTPTEWHTVPGWPGDELKASWNAWQGSCKRLAKRPDWSALCADSQTVSSDETAIRAFFESRFQAWRISNSNGQDSGLITGYYEPLLNGSLQAGPGRVPLYAVPDDLLTIDLSSLFPDLKNQRVRGRLDGKKVVPYWSRAEIAAGRAALEGKVIAWADDPVEAFFLEIQGSGRIALEDGSLLRVGYADQNGHPYKSIGKWLVDQGELTMDQASMQSIRSWARNNPQRLRELLDTNPSNVFFRILPDATGGPIGALNVPLTDGASIAVDPKFIPLGAPVFLTTTRPDNQSPLARLMHAQDTGGAIRGPVRADFFWGFGDAAGELAGRMKQQGQLWLLWPRELPLPKQP